MKTKPPFLSIVIPVYNESQRLFNLDEIFQFARKLKKTTEVLVINDGSTDDTLKKLQQFPRNNFKIITYPKNRGKGFALKQGMLKASGQYVLFTDVDLSTPLLEFSKFATYLEKYPVIIATRKTSGSKLIQHQPILRETLGKGFTFLSRQILGVQVSDFTCGFKCFSASASQQIFSRLTIDRWGYDSEVLFLAKKLKLPIKEVTVTWKNDSLSKVKFPQDIIRSLSDLLTIRVNDIKGRYNRT